MTGMPGWRSLVRGGDRAGGFDGVAADRLQRHFGGELGIVAQAEEVTRLRPRGPVFGQVAARRSHQPHRRRVHPPARERAKEHLVGGFRCAGGGRLSHAGLLRLPVRPSRPDHYQARGTALTAPPRPFIAHDHRPVPPPRPRPTVLHRHQRSINCLFAPAVASPGVLRRELPILDLTWKLARSNNSGPEFPNHCCADARSAAPWHPGHRASHHRGRTAGVAAPRGGRWVIQLSRTVRALVAPSTVVAARPRPRRLFHQGRWGSYL